MAVFTPAHVAMQATDEEKAAVRQYQAEMGMAAEKKVESYMRSRTTGHVTMLDPTGGCQAIMLDPTGGC